MAVEVTLTNTQLYKKCFESRFMLIIPNKSPFISPNLNWKYCGL